MNTLFWLTLVVEGIFALGFIFFPGAMLGNFGVVLNDTATTMARLFGTALLSFPVLLWLAVHSGKAEFKKGAAAALFTYYLASAPVLIIARTTGQMNAAGWSVIGLHLVLLFWFAFFLIQPKAD